MDAATIAEKLNFHICSAFNQFSFDMWVKYELGNKDPAVLQFLQEISNSCDNLA
jgi:hypothetical protein